MNSGKLRNRIVIEQVTEGRSGTGAVVETWSTFATVWAEKREPRGRELFAADTTKSEVSVVFVIRYLPGVTAKMRATLDGKVYEIKAALDPDDRKREHNLLCTTGVTNG